MSKRLISKAAEELLGNQTYSNAHRAWGIGWQRWRRAVCRTCQEGLGFFSECPLKGRARDSCERSAALPK